MKARGQIIFTDPVDRPDARQNSQTIWSSAERRIDQFDAFLLDSRRRSSIRFRPRQLQGDLTISQLLERLEEE